jgi:hypothetical protein
MSPRSSGRAGSGVGVRLTPCLGCVRWGARLTASDAPTRAAVAAVQSGDPGRFRLSEPGGAREVGRGPRRRYAVGASGRRLGTSPRWGEQQ